MLSSLWIFMAVGLSYAQDLSCSSGKLRWIEFGEQKTESAEYCFNEERNTLVSKNCQSMKCDAYKSKKKFKISALLSPVGKPGSRLCRELGGDFKIIEFAVKNQWFKLDRCQFKDGGFVDTDYLLAHYLKR